MSKECPKVSIYANTDSTHNWVSTDYKSWNRIDKLKFYLIVSDLTWPTYQPTHPPNHPSTHLYVRESQQIINLQKKIELSELGQDLFDS